MATYSECQLREVLTQMWSNHFHTQWSDVRNKYRDSFDPPLDNADASTQASAWEFQESSNFRANALGNFRDLVEISAKSPAMSYYLDGVLNVAGNPNENYPREVMELHTMSVDGGFKQTDVEEVAVAFTGWTVDAAGNYTCDPLTHDNATITLDLGLADLGLPSPTPFPPQADCEAAGQYVLDELVNHPATAEYICQELTTVLVSEDPGSAGFSNVVAACQSAYTANLSNSDQIAQMVLAMLSTTEYLDS